MTTGGKPRPHRDFEPVATRPESARRVKWGLGAALLLVAVGGLALWARRAQVDAERQRLTESRGDELSDARGRMLSHRYRGKQAWSV